MTLPDFSLHTQMHFECVKVNRSHMINQKRSTFRCKFQIKTTFFLLRLTQRNTSLQSVKKLLRETLPTMKENIDFDTVEKQKCFFS